MKEGKARYHGRIIKFGGWSFIVAGIFYPILILNANPPKSIDLPAAELLSSLQSGNSMEFLFWIFATLIPLLLISGSFGAYEALKDRSLLVMKLAMVAIFLATFSLMMGMLKWSGLSWHLASLYSEANGQEKQILESVYQHMDLYLGTYFGQYLADGMFFTFVLLTSYVSYRHKRMPNWQALLGFVTATFGLVGAFRHIDESAQAFYQVSLSLSLTPIWMITLGVGLLLYKYRS